MPFVLRNVRLELDQPEEELPHALARRLRVPPVAIRHYAVLRRSIDARHHDDVHRTYTVELALADGPRAERACLRRFSRAEAQWISPPPPQTLHPGTHPLPAPPVIVGFGPGGMFAALRLAELGYRPVVLERGRDVRRRHRDVMHRYYRQRDFDPTSNLLFGEGGAGTYSDGKLYTRRHDPLVRAVLETLYRFGADPDILLDAHPHVGSDRLPRICWNIRDEITRLGGAILFEHCLDDVEIIDAALRRIRVNGAWQPVGPVVLAIGHSARDTIRLLAARGVELVARPFQIGARIEHPQPLVDRWQYGAACGSAHLPPAEYFVVAKAAATGLPGTQAADLFSFCMCPGGMILPSNESPELIVTNGASRANRAGPFANAGLVITLDPKVLGFGPLDALAFQELWEKRAYHATHATYRVPMQRVTDFLADQPSSGSLHTSFPLGGSWARLRDLIPPQISDALLRGLPILESRMPGFAGSQATLAAPETRASAPLRIVRDPDTRESVSAAGLYPVGEGAGYAGGIVSAAIDGIRTAETIIHRFAPIV